MYLISIDLISWQIEYLRLRMLKSKLHVITQLFISFLLGSRDALDPVCALWNIQALDKGGGWSPRRGIRLIAGFSDFRTWNRGIWEGDGPGTHLRNRGGQYQNSTIIGGSDTSCDLGFGSCNPFFAAPSTQQKSLFNKLWLLIVFLIKDFSAALLKPQIFIWSFWCSFCHNFSEEW